MVIHYKDDCVDILILPDHISVRTRLPPPPWEAVCTEDALKMDEDEDCHRLNQNPFVVGDANIDREMAGRAANSDRDRAGQGPGPGGRLAPDGPARGVFRV